jgi:rare lipoprotein A
MRAWLVGLIAIALLSACAQKSVIPRNTDSAPARPKDVSGVADAVPRHEPRSRYGNPAHYEVFGQRYYVLASAHGFTERGIASWYGNKFHGRRTSSGEPYDMYAMTAAHKQLPLPSYVEVTNLSNGRKVIVRVNDRGPFVKNRTIDLSYAAASRLDMLSAGTAPVSIRTLLPGTTPQAVTTATVPGGNIMYYIQAGAFSDRNNADRLRSQLDSYKLGVPSRLESVELGGRLLHRVRLGPLPTVSEVDRLSLALAKYGHQNTQVVIPD